MSGYLARLAAHSLGTAISGAVKPEVPGVPSGDMPGEVLGESPAVWPVTEPGAVRPLVPSLFEPPEPGPGVLPYPSFPAASLAPERPAATTRVSPRAPLPPVPVAPLPAPRIAAPAPAPPRTPTPTAVPRVEPPAPRSTVPSARTPAVQPAVRDDTPRPLPRPATPPAPAATRAPAAAARARHQPLRPGRPAAPQPPAGIQVIDVAPPAAEPAAKVTLSEPQPVSRLAPHTSVRRDPAPAPVLPDVHVTIGRVEVRATGDPAPKPRQGTAPAAQTLADYLRTKQERRR
ncbi:hypothetical protein [Jidongwangia harbinensis]|uniref:hypothetical protein n=1 Tax=Jidongwangia harbinensis TaxID=2878561 RepID=UPI001CDA03FB|nr:hypothetical protein [Jidongwangia harbinensis]MCA2218011.1 hypothetical protein [Jidongwangia harbinensis]